MFKYAKSLGHHLIVGLDSDEKIKKDKGEDRPYNSLEDRKFALESIRYVDEVRVFDSTKGLEELLKSIQPDIMVIGSDWKGQKVIGHQHAGHLRFFDRVGSYSTTNILENVR